MRFSLSFLLLVVAGCFGAAPQASAASQAPDGATQAGSTQVPPTHKFATQAAPNGAEPAAPTEPRALYQALNELRTDGARVYAVEDLTLRRDVVSLTFGEGKLAFLQALGGRVTGLVFTGQGNVLATPHERGERRSLAQYIGVPILDQSFSEAYIRFSDDTASEIEKQLQQSGAQAGSDPVFTAYWNPLVAKLAPAHSLRILTDWLSSQPLPFFCALLQTDGAGAVEVSVDQRREEQVTIGQPRMNFGIASYDLWASFRAENAAAAPASFLPVDYRVESTIEDDLTLHGKTTLHLRAARAGERVVAVELSHQLTVDEAQDEAGRALPYFQNEELSRRDAARRGNDFILVVLPQAKRAGEDFRLQIAYHGNVISDAGNGVDFVGERGAWFAHLGGEHFTPFDLSFRWPKRLTLVATGVESGAREDGSARSGEWRSEEPFCTAGFNLSQYQMASTGSAPRIQVYANKELEEAMIVRLEPAEPNEAPPPSLLDRYKATDGLSGAINTPPAPSPASGLKELGASVQDSIRFFEKLNGAFPFAHLDVTQIPGSFGQGWPGLVYLSTLAFLPRQTQQRAGMNEWEQSEARELMPFHEVAHQWWGNVTSAASYRDVWIQEGMASYLSLWYADSKRPAEHVLANWLEHYRAELTEKVPGTNHTAEEAGPLVLGRRLATSKAPGDYSTVIYGKGAWVMQMLREMLRDPGAKDPDARFKELLRATLTDYRFRTLSTADFQRAVEQQMTPAMDIEGTHRMDWFFEQWVRGTDLPHYSVKFEVKPHGKEFRVSGEIEQEGVEDVFTAPVPLYAQRTGGKPERLGVVVTTGEETRFHFESRIRPTRIVIDPYLTLLWNPAAVESADGGKSTTD
ncbi:MAG: M1 family aminopeptidase [Candidatus Acidiferrales bacterium]